MFGRIAAVLGVLAGAGRRLFRARRVGDRRGPADGMVAAGGIGDRHGPGSLNGLTPPHHDSGGRHRRAAPDVRQTLGGGVSVPHAITAVNPDMAGALCP